VGIKSLAAFAFAAVTSQILLSAIAQHPSRSLRTWTSRQGSTVVAGLIGVEHGQVKLQLKDGRVMSFAVDLLAPDDMKYAVDESGWGHVWQDATGQHQTLADFVSLEGSVAKLERTDGTIISVPLATLSVAGRRYIEKRLTQDAAVAALKKVGARVDHVSAVYLEGPRATNAAVSHLEQLLPDLRTLHLWYTDNITDEGISRIGQLQSLKTLHLGSTKLTDAGVAPLQTCKVSPT